MTDLPRYWMDEADHARGYAIFDRTRGRNNPVVDRVHDPEMAARIVRLLNADVEAAARLGQQRACAKIDRMYISQETEAAKR